MALCKLQIIFMRKAMIKNEFFFESLAKEDIKLYLHRMQGEIQSGDIGYYHLPLMGKALIKQAKDFIKNKSYKNIIVIGVGGSSLGVKALAEALKKDDKNIFFLDNLSSSLCKEVFEQINYEESIFVLSSKSGTTIETITLFKIIIEEFQVKDFSENFVIISEDDSKLADFARKNKIELFHLPKNVGGRFSVLSAIGLVPLFFYGLNVEEILEGAKFCKKRFLEDKDEALLQKAYHYATSYKININVLFSYSEKLKYFNEWFVQLWAESLGKKLGYKRIGLTPVALIGSKDQHSFLQLIMDGPKDKSVTFIKVKKDKEDRKISSSLEFLESCDYVNGFTLNEILNAQCEATMQAVINEGLSVDLLEIDELNEASLGFLLYYFELLTSATGLMLGINTYDQPGVEVGKRILKNILLKNK